MMRAQKVQVCVRSDDTVSFRVLYYRQYHAAAGYLLLLTAGRRSICIAVSCRRRLPTASYSWTSVQLHVAREWARLHEIS
jgi:hypothetical protein